VSEFGIGFQVLSNGGIGRILFVKKALRSFQPQKKAVGFPNLLKILLVSTKFRAFFCTRNHEQAQPKTQGNVLDRNSRNRSL